MNTKPLEGIKVVELSTYMAAPICGKLLAEWGADVIKIDPINGDPQRLYGSVHQMSVTDDENAVWQFINANKKGMAIDIKTPQGMEIIHRLLVKADIFITNTKSQALEKIKLSYDDLKDIYPKLIYGRISGYGDKGKRANDPGFDGITFWAETGFQIDIGAPGYPTWSPGTIGDYFTGTQLFAGMLLGILKRGKTGKGDYISTSLLGTALNGMVIPILCASYYGYKYPKARGDQMPLAAIYQCKDGESIMLAVLDYPRLFPVMCKEFGLEELINDERFSTREQMNKNRPALISILEETFIKEDSCYWMDIFKRQGIPATIMGRFKDQANNEQGLAAGYLNEFLFPSGRKMNLPGNQIQSAELGLNMMNPAPLFGENTKEILAGLGYSTEQINSLKDNKIVKFM